MLTERTIKPTSEREKLDLKDGKGREETKSV